MLFEMCYRISRLLFLLLLTRESSPTDCRPTIGRLVIQKYTDSRTTVDRLWPTVGRQSVFMSADASVDSRPTVDRLRAKVHLIQGPNTAAETIFSCEGQMFER